MAVKEINLVPSTAVKEHKAKEFRHTTNLVAFAFIGVLILASVGVTVLSIVTNRQRTAVDEAIKAEQRKITSFGNVESDAARLQRKINSLSSIIGDRSQYSQLLEILSESTPEGVTVVDLVASTSKKVDVSGEAQSYVALARFLLGVLDPEVGGQLFNEADLTSVSLDDKTRKARFVVTLYLREGALDLE